MTLQEIIKFVEAKNKEYYEVRILKDGLECDFWASLSMDLNKIANSLKSLEIPNQIEKSAKEMFEELGFIEDNNKDYIFKYNFVNGGFVGFFEDGSVYISSLIIAKLPLIKAITKQLKEMGNAKNKKD